jgi:acetyl-CoA carboxylase biotin carboxylase subunit
MLRPVWNTLLVVNPGRLATRLERAAGSLEISLSLFEAPLGGDSLEGVLATLKRTGADALLLADVPAAERAVLARGAIAAGATLIGPTVEALEMLANKGALRALAAGEGLRVLDGQADQEIVHTLEVVVCRDSAGDEIVLDERDTTLSASGRAALIETPSPKLIHRSDGESVRQALEDYAVRIIRKLDTSGVLTVTFGIDVDEAVWFLDASAHDFGAAAATECILGVDTTALMLRIARGEPVPDPATLFRNGHAFEATLIAQSSEGDTKSVVLPAPQRGELRIEASEDLTKHVSGAVALLTTHEETRHRAMFRLDRALAGTQAPAALTNRDGLRAVFNDERFRSGVYDANFVPKVEPRAEVKPEAKPDRPPDRSSRTSIRPR